MQLASIAGKAHLLPVPAELPFLNDVIAFAEKYNSFLDDLLQDRAGPLAAAAAAGEGAAKKAAMSYFAKSTAMLGMGKKAVAAVEEVAVVTEVSRAAAV